MTRPVRRLALTFVLALAAVVVATETVAAATTPAAFGYGTPGFFVSPAPSDLENTYLAGTPLTGGLWFPDQGSAGEPSIGIDWRTGAAYYQADISTYKLTFDNAQANPVTWSNVTSPYSKFNADPILATDHATGTTLAGGDDGACAVMSVTTGVDAQQDPTAWTPSTPCPFAADHPTVGMGPYAGTPPVNATAPFVTYFCQQGDVDSCSHSVDGGLTWSPSVPDPNLTCISLFGHVKVSADGTAYIPSANCIDADGNLAVGAITSTDNGQSLSGVVIPDAPAPADGFDPSVATDSGNRVYESWSRAGDYHPVVTWSDDHGAHWAPQVELGTDLAKPLVAATFESAVAGDAGRAAVAFLGTSDGAPGVDPFTTGFNGVWYLYVSYTYDGGATWHTTLADPQPVQRGEIDAGGTTTSGQRNLLDFMDANLTKDGRVVVAYADGCLDNDPTTHVNCNAGGTAADSTASYATVAYQTTGEGLFSAYDVTPVTAPAAPSAAAADGNGKVALTWTTPADGGSPITGYQIYRGLTAGTETPYTSVGAVTSYADAAVTAGQTYFYTVRATNGAGTGAASPETSAVPTTVPSAPALTATGGKSAVTLSWTTPADGGAAITGWAIYRATTSGGEQLIQTISSGMSYVDNTVTGGTTYYYEVAAINRNGTGALSREASASPKKGR